MAIGFAFFIFLLAVYFAILAIIFALTKASHNYDDFSLYGAATFFLLIVAAVDCMFLRSFDLPSLLLWLLFFSVCSALIYLWYKRFASDFSPPFPGQLSVDTFIAELTLSEAVKQYPIIEQKLREFHRRYAAVDDRKHYPHYLDKIRTGLSEFEKRLNELAYDPNAVFFIPAENPDYLIEPLTKITSTFYTFTTADISPPIALNIPRHAWFEGSWIVAPSGRGKTTLLKYLVTKVPEPDACIIIMDAKGELLQPFNQLAQWKDRYVYLQPSADFPLAINPLEIGHSVEFLEYIFSALLESKMTPNQSTLFRMVLTLCKVIPNANLETFRLILARGPKEFEQYVRKLKPRDQDFFDMEWKERIYAERRPEVLARLRTLMTHDALDAILQAPHTKIDLGKLMDEGKVICINNNYEDLGEQGCEFFGRLFISLVWAAARKRSQRTGYKRPVYFFIDEAHYVIARDTKISTILNQCRAQNIAMLFAHQQVQQIKDDDVKAALNDCAIKFANSSGEAHELAPRLETTADFLKSQKRGQFALHVRDTTPTAVSVSVTPVDLNQYPKLSRDQIEAILRNTIIDYCYVYTEQTYSQTTEETQRDADLYWKRTLSPKLALKGGFHNVPVTDNDRKPKILRVVIKPNTKHGDKARIRGYGAFKANGTRGDVIIEWIIPQRPDKREPPKADPFGIPPPDDEERW